MCSAQTTSAQSKAVGTSTAPAASDGSGSIQNGTVIDFAHGLKGIVSSVDTSVPSIVVKATDSSRTLFVTLEEGYPGALEGLNQGDPVFCTVSVTKQFPTATDGSIPINATCYYAVDFAVDSHADKAIKAAAKGSKMEHQVAIALAAIQLATTDSALSPVCVLAILFAMADSSWQQSNMLMTAAGFLPYDADCIPSSDPGIVDVVFRYRNTFGQERALLVPVRMRTWGELVSYFDTGLSTGVNSNGVREVSPLKYCAPRCIACRIACRTAQGLAIAQCPATGPAAILCAAVALEAGNECYDRC
jgi:hypothetical protein